MKPFVLMLIAPLALGMARPSLADATPPAGSMPAQIGRSGSTFGAPSVPGSPNKALPVDPELAKRLEQAERELKRAEVIQGLESLLAQNKRSESAGSRRMLDAIAPSPTTSGVSPGPVPVPSGRGFAPQPSVEAQSAQIFDFVNRQMELRRDEKARKDAIAREGRERAERDLRASQAAEAEERARRDAVAREERERAERDARARQALESEERARKERIDQANAERKARIDEANADRLLEYRKLCAEQAQRDKDRDLRKYEIKQQNNPFLKK